MSSQRSPITRVLHLFLLLIVVHQLGTSLIMERPLPGDEPEAPFLAHQWLGSAGLAAVLLFWLWALVRSRRETSIGSLVPWFSARRLAAVWKDLRSLSQALTQRHAPPLDALASAVHGLGLLTLTAMAATGVAWLLFLQGGPLGRPVLEAHELLAKAMWAFVIGHAGAAAAHGLFGRDVFADMFWRSPRRFASPGE
jgi:cytochrome b561